MLKWFKITLLLLFPLLGLPQTNLVPNPGFENYTSCPSTLSQINQASSWYSSRSSPDYFNNCALLASGVSTPSNSAGYQNPSGNGYAGFYAYYPSNPNGRETIECQLNSTLTLGVKYFVSFKVNLCNIDSELWFNTAVNRLGILFSKVQHSTVSPTPIGNYSQVSALNVISDTLNWVKISGSFVSDSVYKYLAIGNFFDDATTNKTFFFNGPFFASYYFVDDVCVSTDSLYSLNWPLSSIVEQTQKTDLTIYPNPSNDYVIIDLNEEYGMFSISSITSGNIIRKSEEFHRNDRINVTDLPSGIYILKVELKGKQKHFRLCINH